MNNKGSSILGLLFVGFLFGIGGAVGVNMVNGLDTGEVEEVKVNHICKMSDSEMEEHSLFMGCVPVNLYDKDCTECMKIVKEIERCAKERNDKSAKWFFVGLVGLVLLGIICRILNAYVE